MQDKSRDFLPALIFLQKNISHSGDKILKFFNMLDIMLDGFP